MSAAAKAAEQLATARHDRRAVTGLPSVQSFDDAYATQDAFVRLWADSVIGHKVGCSSERSQQLVKAPGPIAGRLFHSDHWRSPATLDSSAFFLLGVEAEFGFVLGSDLPARTTPYALAEATAAVSAVIPLIEICDTRLAQCQTRRIEEITADNAFHGGIVTGQPCQDWRSLDLRHHAVTLAIDGVVKGSGTGADVLGDPLIALTWLVNELSRRGIGMRSGELVAAGTCTGLHIATPGSTVLGDFGTLGVVEIRFATAS